MDIVYYTVRPGNTLFGIAQFFQTTVNDILRYNNIADANRIYVGANSGNSGRNFTVATHTYCKTGRIPLVYLKDVQYDGRDLMNKNNLGNPNVLYPGQILNV